MNFNTQTIDITQLSKSCPVVALFEDNVLSPSAKKLDKLSGGKISALLKQGTFQAKLGDTFLLYDLPNLPVHYVLLVGAGTADKMNARKFKKLVSQATKLLMTSKMTEVTSFLNEAYQEKNAAWLAKCITETALDTIYQFTLFKSKKEPAFQFKSFVIAAQESEIKAAKIGIKQGLAIANAVNLTKNLANTPSNVCTPSFLAEQAKSLAKTHHLKVTVLHEKDMQKLGMGLILGVSQGSAEEAKLICLEYHGAKKNVPPIAFVGKGITFDTGGNSIKPADAMVGMKYDMCGAATVLGVLQATAELELPINVIGVIAAVENMPGGTAYKPEDILTSMSGVTVEVISTDAEGRLVLGDALTYCERFKPETVIDIATLTGAAVIALGVHATAVLSNHEPLAKALLTASEDSLDRAWELPIWDEFREQIKSPFADIANVGGRAGGVITAACFLEHFAKKFHWAHLDVAGTAAMMMGGTNDRRATGRPVPMLMQYLIQRASHDHD